MVDIMKIFCESVDLPLPTITKGFFAFTNKFAACSINFASGYDRGGDGQDKTLAILLSSTFCVNNVAGKSR